MRAQSRIIARLFAAVAFLGSISGIAGSVNAYGAENSSIPRMINVSGQGEVSGKPDQASLSAGVLTQAPTAAAALTANTTAMNRVFEALRAAGIPDNKIRTSNFSVQPQYPPYKPDSPDTRTIIGYQVSNQVSVVVGDLSKLGPALDALVKSGANQLGGVSFSIADPKPLAERARAAAVADAMAKARTLASAAGVTLGPLLSIQEGGGIRPVPLFEARAVAAQVAPPPIAVGEESVSVNVTMSYAIQ